MDVLVLVLQVESCELLRADGDVRLVINARSSFRAPFFPPVMMGHVKREDWRYDGVWCYEQFFKQI